MILLFGREFIFILYGGLIEKIFPKVKRSTAFPIYGTPKYPWYYI